MIKSNKKSMSFLCFILAFVMVFSYSIMPVEAKEKQAKFNKQYSGKIDGYHSMTYNLKVPADGTFYIRYSSKGSYYLKRRNRILIFYSKNLHKE